MPDRPVGLQFVAGQQLFWISQCEVLIAYLRVYRLGENTVSHSVSALGVPVTQYSGLAAITAWHCVSSVNTDDSRHAELYIIIPRSYNIGISKLATATKPMIYR